ncbi:hypothetical protein D3C72_2519660 [compost metagenome]
MDDTRWQGDGQTQAKLECVNNGIDFSLILSIDRTLFVTGLDGCVHGVEQMHPSHEVRR